MNDLFHKILMHLYETNSLNQNVDITDFLKQTLGDYNNSAVLQNIATTLHHLVASGFIAGLAVPPLGKQGNGSKTNNLDEHKISVTLKLQGHNYIEQKISQVKQDYLLKRQTDAIEQTNKSTLKLNEEVLPQNFKSQEKSSKQSFWLAFVSASISTIIIAATAYLQYKDSTDEQLKELKQEVQKSSTALDSIQHYLKNINSSLQNVNTDTLLVKKKK